jgi:hypothetical protein
MLCVMRIFPENKELAPRRQYSMSCFLRLVSSFVIVVFVTADFVAAFAQVTQLEETPKVARMPEACKQLRGCGQGWTDLKRDYNVRQTEVSAMTDKVIAEVILRSANGSSILDATEGVTAQTIARYRVGGEVIKEASRKLEALGFEVVQAAPTGLTISGSKDLFEKVFQTTVEVRTKSVMPPEAKAGERAYYQATKPIQVPPDLYSLVAGVTLPTPPEYFP